ncbi:VWA domain-containing protein [Streptomyces sp. NPDC008121]|uniref:VWA domain-containing protein n=1 Tax=Streptomyces sp. NPDC008121 TaxID=3364809 RepID=UPI0036E19E6C
MGIRSLLRKVFGRDRADQHVETTATSVPSQTASERATPDEAGSVTLPSPTPPDEAAKRAADDLVAASFDNPKVPQARTSSTRESVRTGGTGSSSDTPQEPETPTESTGVPAARDGAEAEAEEAAVEAAPAEAEAEESAEAEAETPAEPEAEADATEAPEAEAEPAEAVADEAEPETDEAEVTAEPETADAEAEPVEAEADATDEAPEAEAEPAEAVAEEPAAEAEPETDEAEAEVTAEPETADAEPEPAPTEAEAEAEVTDEPEPTPTEAEAEATSPTPTPALTLAAVKAKAPQLADAYKAAGTVLKKQGLTGARAAVYLVVDRSGSMRGYFKDGSVQRIAEQTVALAAHLTEDATVTAVFFSTDIDGTAELRPEGIEGRIDEINADLGRLGRTNYHRAVEEVLAHHEKTDPTRPAFVVFQTDGAPDLKTAATEALAQAADRPIHWQFVAWGEEDNKAFDYLRKLTAPRTGTFFAGATPAETGHPAFFRGLLADWQTQDGA